MYVVPEHSEHVHYLANVMKVHGEVSLQYSTVLENTLWLGEPQLPPSTQTLITPPTHMPSVHWRLSPLVCGSEDQVLSSPCAKTEP